MKFIASPAFMLAAAIFFELIATASLKASAGFSRLLPSLLTIGGYAASFYLLGLTLKRMEVGVVYAIWSGAGTALMAVIGWWLFSESMTLLKVMSITLIVVGVIGLNIGLKVDVGNPGKFPDVTSDSAAQTSPPPG
jgi:small multidrug resistance pump